MNSFVLCSRFLRIFLVLSTKVCFCALAVVECTGNPCQNGGTCNYQGSGHYTCSCTGTYIGAHCELRGKSSIIVGTCILLKPCCLVFVCCLLLFLLLLFYSAWVQHIYEAVQRGPQRKLHSHELKRTQMWLRLSCSRLVPFRPKRGKQNADSVCA